MQISQFQEYRPKCTVLNVEQRGVILVMEHVMLRQWQYTVSDE
jgi:hypothetical protein